MSSKGVALGVDVNNKNIQKGVAVKKATLVKGILQKRLITKDPVRVHCSKIAVHKMNRSERVLSFSFWIYVPIHTYTHLHIYIYTHMYAYTHIHIYKYTRIHIYTYVHCGVDSGVS